MSTFGVSASNRCRLASHDDPRKIEHDTARWGREECQEAAGQAPRCTAEFDAVLQCALTQQNCDIEDSCEPQLQAWAACAAATGCGPQECRGGGSGGGEETCSCNAVCEGTPVTADCTIDAAGGATCQCLANGMPVGECTEPQSSFCDVSEGCCAQFF